MTLDTSYGYCNARIKAMQTRLLPKATMTELMQVSSLAEVTQVLEQTTYKDAFVASSTSHSGINLVLDGLQKDFLATLQKVQAMLPKKAIALMHAMTLEWEIADLKAIISKKALGTEVKESELVFYSRELVSKALEAKDVAGVLDVISEKYPLAFAKKEYAEKKDFRLLLDALDNWHCARLMEMAESLPQNDRSKALLHYKLFLQNALLVLRMKKGGYSEKEILGKLFLNDNTLKQMAQAEDLPSAILVLESAKGIEVGEKGRKLLLVEMDLEKHFYEKARKALKLEVLSFGVVMGYLYLKTIEVANLRKIALGKHFGIEGLMQNHLVL